MITVEISSKELLRQLPQKAGYALMEWLDEMPAKFIFETLPIQSKEEEIEEKYPEVWKRCTPKEKALFLTLYKRGKVGVHHLEDLIGSSDENSYVQNSNTVAVHIKNLRQELKDSPFRIITWRAGFNLPSRYEMREVKL